MSETGYKPGLVGWIFLLRCQDFILHFVQLKPKFKFCFKLFQVRKKQEHEVVITNFAVFFSIVLCLSPFGKLQELNFFSAKHLTPTQVSRYIQVVEKTLSWNQVRHQMQVSDDFVAFIPHSKTMTKKYLKNGQSVFIFRISKTQH